MTELEHAIKHIKTRADAWAVKEVTEALRSISERLDKALSQEQKYGEWKVTPMSKIAYCSICDELIKDVPASIVTQFEFCPKCGHRMVEPQESEEQTE